jgi:hypothetical protein
MILLLLVFMNEEEEEEEISQRAILHFIPFLSRPMPLFFSRVYTHLFLSLSLSLHRCR